jgi:hypothetical protein
MKLCHLAQKLCKAGAALFTADLCKKTPDIRQLPFGKIFPKMLSGRRPRRPRREQCLLGQQRQTALIQLREKLLATSSTRC